MRCRRLTAVNGNADWKNLGLLGNATGWGQIKRASEGLTMGYVSRTIVAEVGGDHGLFPRILSDGLI